MKVNLPKGTVFYNGKIEYLVLHFSESEHDNLALLERQTYCPFVVARNITKKSDGTYTWALAHYFNNLEYAFNDYEERLLKLH